jgi:hypothetical protein
MEHFIHFSVNGMMCRSIIVGVWGGRIVEESAGKWRVRRKACLSSVDPLLKVKRNVHA